MSNIMSVTTTLQTGTDIQRFCYDEQNRLTSATANSTASCGSFTTGPQGSYTYSSSSHLHAVASTGNGYSAAYDAQATCYLNL